MLSGSDIRVRNLRGVVANVRLIIPFWKLRRKVADTTYYPGPFFFLTSIMRAIKGRSSPHSVPIINSLHVSHNAIGVLLVWCISFVEFLARPTDTHHVVTPL